MRNLSHTILERGEEVLFAFEEAIGLMIVLDKDGVSVAAVTGEMAAHLYTNGQAFSFLLENIIINTAMLCSVFLIFSCF